MMNYDGPPPRSTRRFLDQIADLHTVARQVCSERDLLLESPLALPATQELAAAWERGYSAGYWDGEEGLLSRSLRNPYLPEE